jgi:hypothetical protein
LNALSVQTDPDRSRRIVWMINQMIKPQREEPLVSEPGDTRAFWLL